MSDRILPAEAQLREGLVDDCDLLRARPVLRREVTPREQRRAHHCKVAGCDAIEECVFVRSRDGAAVNQYEVRPLAALERRHARASDRRYSWQCAELLLDGLKRRDVLLRLQIGGTQACAHEQYVLSVEAGIESYQLVEAAQK